MRSLQHWYTVTRHARWQNFTQTRQTFSHADQVKVTSGGTVTVFNIGGNNFRLLAAIHYPRGQTRDGRVYVLRVLTHTEYDDGRWRTEL